MNKLKVADLHCDLLCYLAGGAPRSPYDAVVRCSLSQMLQGGVALQVLPVFTMTGAGSTEKGARQVEAFARLLKSETPMLRLSIENASGFFEEDEPLTTGLKRLETLLDRFQHIVYISPTWNSENRFGGGAWAPDIGLKADGKALLDFMHGRKIAFDASHNSDRLLKEALAYIDQKQLDIPVIASHSNMRAVTDVPRNLPDPLVREILQRGGLIGLNFYRPFVGADESFLARQMEHLLSLGGESQVCFGADFFWDEDLPPALRRPPLEMFFPNVNDSSTYPYVLDLWRKQLGLSPSTLQAIAYDNLARFLNPMINSGISSEPVHGKMLLL